jgi:hypothetical protein
MEAYNLHFKLEFPGLQSYRVARRHHLALVGTLAWTCRIHRTRRLVFRSAQRSSLPSKCRLYSRYRHWQALPRSRLEHSRPQACGLLRLSLGWSCSEGLVRRIFVKLFYRLSSEMMDEPLYWWPPRWVRAPKETSTRQWSLMSKSGPRLSTAIK